MGKVAIRDLASELSKSDRRDRFIHRVLQGLAAEGHQEVEKLVFPSWQPIMAPGAAKGLYLILSGNASVAFPRNSSDPVKFTRDLRNVPRENNPVAKLNELAFCHPIVLCKGDLIGEFEYVQKRDAMAHVIAATFFKTPETRKRLQTIVIRLPEDSQFASSISYDSMMEKLALLNHLLLPNIHSRQSRINNILALCFAGLFPVYRVFYRTSNGKYNDETPDRCPVFLKPGEAMKADEEENYACLARLDPHRDPVGIEVSTSYLMRCFGFSNNQSITSDVNTYTLDVYSDTARVKHLEKIEHLGAESLLFFIHGRSEHYAKSAKEFCSEFGLELRPDAITEGPGLLAGSGLLPISIPANV